MKKSQSWTLFLGSFPPRECGIATFTKDITSAIDQQFSPDIKTKIAAMNRNGINIYNYSDDVLFQINDQDIQEYIDVAKKINKIDKIKLVCIQHEFGLFGGEYGSYLIAFLEVINKPVVMTFHSVMPNPDPNLKKVVQTLAKKSNCIIVMADKGKQILNEEYDIHSSIEVIPHGIPTIEFTDSATEKAKLGLPIGKTILSSFGMINRGKGYEYVIQALSKVVKKYPDLLYLIVGETHPVIRKNEGESYRNFLENKIKKLKLQKNIKFYNKYVTLEEIISYLKATDIFICSNKEPNQITSGTLAYAVGAGRAVISTPFLHAKELISPERGILVDFNNSASFERAILKLIKDERLKKSMEENAYANTRNMTWDNAALAYNDVFQRHVNLTGNYLVKVPEIKLNHLVKMSNDFGVIQFAKKVKPDISSGYTLDDNARAMIACCMFEELHGHGSKLDLIRTYLNFMRYVQHKNGKFYNFVDPNRHVDHNTFSEDSHGRTLWSLGFLMNSSNIPEKYKNEAESMFERAPTKDIKSLRGMAFAILGLYYYNKAKPSRKNTIKIKSFADALVSAYDKSSSKDWHWFEDCLTYSNSRLPDALFCAYLATQDKRYLNVAKSSLDFLSSITFENDKYVPIGQDGWYLQNRKRAHFDQQPVEASSMVQTLLTAHKVTNNMNYLRNAVRAFHWFLGQNHLNQIIYDETTGGCYDGIGKFTINLNQGAESTISYLIARLSLQKLRSQE